MRSQDKIKLGTDFIISIFSYRECTRTLHIAKHILSSYTEGVCMLYMHTPFVWLTFDWLSDYVFVCLHVYMFLRFFVILLVFLSVYVHLLLFICAFDSMFVGLFDCFDTVLGSCLNWTNDCLTVQESDWACSTESILVCLSVFLMVWLREGVFDCFSRLLVWLRDDLFDWLSNCLFGCFTKWVS